MLHLSQPLPEASCSTNAFVEIAGTRHQVTARGTSPAEMADNYFASVEALQALYAARQVAEASPLPPSLPSLPVTRVHAMGFLLAKALHKAVEDGDPSRLDRLCKGAAIMLADGVQPGTVPDTWTVQSQSSDHTAYAVSGKLCSCTDASKHRAEAAYHCKHVLAVLFSVKINRLVPA
jgi:hypothetical protein